MLQQQTIYPKTLELLRKVMATASLNPFTLVGGTALALQAGHRISVDLDLFTSEKFEEEAVLGALRNFGEVQNLSRSRQSLSMEINEIKVDVFCFAHELMGRSHTVEAVRLLKPEAIASMKLLAICNRGTRKDFVDLYFLLKEYSLEKLISGFLKDFPENNSFMLTKSLLYFEDAESAPMPLMIAKETSWSEMKDFIQGEVEIFLKNDF